MEEIKYILFFVKGGDIVPQTVHVGSEYEAFKFICDYIEDGYILFSMLTIRAK